MYIKKIRLLTATDFIKVSIPLVALLVVFFFKTMIISTIQDVLRDRLSGIVEVRQTDTDDMNFITALLGGGNFTDAKPFQLGMYSGNKFISGFYNNTKPALETAPTTVLAPAQPIIVLPVPQHSVSAVFNGRYRKYAVIDNNITTVGSFLPNGDILRAVMDGRVLISGIWGKQWFYVTY